MRWKRVLYSFFAVAIVALSMAGIRPATAQDTAPTPPASPLTCPADSWAQAQIGANVVFLGTEPCTWTWRSAPNMVPLTCPTDFVCTIDEGQVVVQNGNGQKVNGVGGTFRYMPSFPASDAVWDVCALYPKEVAFGLWADYPTNTRARDPQFKVYYRPVLSTDPATCGDGTLMAKPLAGTADTGNATPAADTANMLDTATVAAWCTPDCSAYVTQLVESDGTTNMAGVKLDGKGKCFTVAFPDGVTYDLFVKKEGSTDPGTSPKGQGKKTYENVCVASIRKVLPRTA